MRFRRRKTRPFGLPVGAPIGNDLPPVALRRGIYLLPNLFTMAALFAGFFAIVQAMSQRFELASIAIFAAMVLDGMDGRVARLTNTQSAFGEQFDSLSDMTSFGVAPALVMYEWILKDLGRWGWAGAFVYCAGAALRLARFNANLGVVDKRFFQGLPVRVAYWAGQAKLIYYADPYVAVEASAGLTDTALAHRTIQERGRRLRDNRYLDEGQNSVTTTRKPGFMSFQRLLTNSAQHLHIIRRSVIGGAG